MNRRACWSSEIDGIIGLGGRFGVLPPLVSLVMDYLSIDQFMFVTGLACVDENGNHYDEQLLLRYDTVTNKIVKKLDISNHVNDNECVMVGSDSKLDILFHSPTVDDPRGIRSVFSWEGDVSYCVSDQNGEIFWLTFNGPTMANHNGGWMLNKRPITLTSDGMMYFSSRDHTCWHRFNCNLKIWDGYAIHIPRGYAGYLFGTIAHGPSSFICFVDAPEVCYLFDGTDISSPKFHPMPPPRHGWCFDSIVGIATSNFILAVSINGKTCCAIRTTDINKPWTEHKLKDSPVELDQYVFIDQTLVGFESDNWNEAIQPRHLYSLDLSTLPQQTPNWRKEFPLPHPNISQFIILPN